MNQQAPGHQWASASSGAVQVGTALDAVITRISEQLGGVSPHVLFVFASGDHRENFPMVSTRLNNAFPGVMMFGSSGGGVIGGGEELDVDSGIAVIAAYTPGVDWAPIYDRGGRPEDLPYSQEDIEDLFGADIDSAAAVLMIPEPFSYNPSSLLEGLNNFAPGLPIIGGLAGGGRKEGEHALFFGDRVLSEGLVALVVRGNIQVETLVAQGCRPLGAPSFITSCKGHVLRELDSRPALMVLRELFQGLSKTEQDRFRTGLLLGIGMDPTAQSYEMGDFVMRNILGLDPESNNIGVSAHLEPHQVVQFHVRDGRAASEDLREMLKAYEGSALEGPPKGALIFSCMGRGSGLFGVPNHDTSLFSELVGEVPIGGFFCNGEIGPVRGTNFLHGFSSSFAFFREISGESTGEESR